MGSKKATEGHAAIQLKVEERRRAFDRMRLSGAPFIEWPRLIDAARKEPRPEPDGTVSHFAEWVFRLYCKRNRAASQVSMSRGAEGERQVEEYRRSAVPEKGDELLFADPLVGSAPIFRISDLRVKEEPLRGRPDVVMRCKESGEVRVKERKVTQAPVPLLGWPNLQVQLWCYGWIDDWREAPEVYLIGEVWHWTWDNHLEQSQIYPRWRRSDAEFHEQCLELFEIYGGSVRV